MSISSFASLLLAALIIYLAIKILSRRSSKAAAPRRERTEIERWIDDALSRELHRKLDIERDVIVRALDGAPDPDAVSSIEEAVRAVQVKYAWNPDGTVDVRLDVSFEDGASASASRVFPRSVMPADVKDELTRTGVSFVLRTVHFPWSTPE